MWPRWGFRKFWTFGFCELLSTCFQNLRADILVFVFIISLLVLVAILIVWWVWWRRVSHYCCLEAGDFVVGGRIAGGLKSCAGHYPDFWTKSTGCSELRSGCPAWSLGCLLRSGQVLLGPVSMCRSREPQLQCPGQALSIEKLSMTHCMIRKNKYPQAFLGTWLFSAIKADFSLQ